jgi:hypothetical protein
VHGCSPSDTATALYPWFGLAIHYTNDREMVRKLEAAPVTLTDGTPDAYLAVRDEAMHSLGIGTTHDMKSVISGLFLPF